MAIAIQKIDKALRDAGIPIFGIDGTRQNAKIQFSPEATAKQKAEGNAMLAAFDWQDDPPPPEYAQKREVIYVSRGYGPQFDAIYHFAKNLPAYIQAGGIVPDIKAAIGTPEEWIAWQDKVREDIPKE